MSVHKFVSELRSCGENSKYYPMNVIDIQLQVVVSWVSVLVSFLNSFKSYLIRSYSVLKFFCMFQTIYSLPKMVTDMSLSHFVDQSAHLSNEPYSSSTCYYLLISQDGCQRRRGTKISQRLQCFTLSSEARRSSSWLNPQSEMSGYFSAGVIQNPMSGMVTLFFQLVGSSEFILFVIILCYVSAQHSSVVSRS